MLKWNQNKLHPAYQTIETFDEHCTLIKCGKKKKIYNVLFPLKKYE